MKKSFFLFISILFFLLTITITKGQTEITVDSQCAVLLERQSGRVLYEKNGHEQRPIASISKIMTAIIAIENEYLDEYVTISKEATKQIGSSLYLKEGEKIKLRDLIYGLMLRSGNDAAYAIAEHVSGNIDDFVYLMNEKAKELGLHNTVFENPSGLDEVNKNISTAYDFAVITGYAMDNPLFRVINNTSRHRAETLSGKIYLWTNKHKLINRYDHIIGGKTGFTKLAKRTLVTVGKKNNLELVVVTLNGGNDWNDHLNLLNYGFKEYEYLTLLDNGIFEVKELERIFYLDDKIAYPIKDEELNDYRFMIDVDDQTKKYYLHLVYKDEIVLTKEIWEYDKTHSVLKNSYTIEDFWMGIKEFVRELLW